MAIDAPTAGITPCGQHLWVVPLKADGSSALNAISAVADGASLAIGGATAAIETASLDKPIFSSGCAGVLFPFDAATRALVAAAKTANTPITATFPLGSITVAGSPTDAATLIPAPFLTDAEFFGAIPAPADRHMLIGMNIEPTREDWISVTLADRSLGSDVWTGDVTLDANYEMVANTGTARRTLLFAPVSDGNLSARGAYLITEGDVKVEFTVSGAAFDAAARSVVTLRNIFSGAWTIGPARFDDLGNGHWRLTQSIARSSDPSGLWTPGLEFYAPTPGVVYTKWAWFDPLTPAGYTKTAHPSEVARLGGWVGPLRSMDWLGINGSYASLVGDFTTPADRIGAVAGGGSGWIVARVNVTSIRPVDLDPATDSDHFNRYFDTNNYCGWFVATVDDSRPFVGRDGVMGAWGGPVSTYAGNIAGNGLSMAEVLEVYPIDGTHLLCMCLAQASYDSSKSAPAQLTLDKTYPVTGTTLSVPKGNLLPLETFLDYCNDLDAPPWVNVPHLATDALIDWMADTTIARTKDGVRVPVEYSNETWNFGFIQINYFNSQYVYANWLHAQDPKTYPFSYTSVIGWIAHRAAYVHSRFRARFVAAGRDPNLVYRVMGSQTMNAGVTEQLCIQCAVEKITFDALAIETYQDLSPPGASISGPDLATSFDRLDASGCISVLAAMSLHGQRPGIVGIHSQVMHDRGFPGVELVGYEGGWGGIGPPAGTASASVGHRVAEMMANFRMHRLSAAYESLIQSLGFKSNCRYTWAYYPIPGNNVAWSDNFTAFSGLGTGKDGENPDPYDYPNLLTQAGGGRRDWATGVDFDGASGPGPGPGPGPNSTPTPTPTPVPTPPPPPPPTLGSVIDAFEAAASSYADAVQAATSATSTRSDRTTALASATLDLARAISAMLANFGANS